MAGRSRGKKGASKKGAKGRNAKKHPPKKGIFTSGGKKKHVHAHNEPLIARGSIDDRLSYSEGVLRNPGPGFHVEDGEVVPNDQGSRRKSGLGLSGGRWQRFALLGAMLFALGLLVINGVYRLAGKALYDPPSLPAASQFPVEGASNYAELFVQKFFSWDSKDASKHDDAMRLFFPAEDADLNVGWNGHGDQAVGATWTVKTDVTDAHRAVITVAADVAAIGDTPETTSSGLLCANVSVYAQGGTGNYAILSYPSIVGCPPAAKFKVKDDSGSGEVDSANTPAIKQVLESFFKAYGESDYTTMQQLVAKSSGIVSGLNKTREFGGFASGPRVPQPLAKGSTTRTAEVSVNWKAPGGNADNNVNDQTPASRSDYIVTLRKEGDHWVITGLKPGAPSPDVAPQKGGVAVPSDTPSSSSASSADGQGDSGGDNGSTG